VVTLSRALEVAKEVRLAEEVLDTALAARPDEVILLNALGRLLERQGPARLVEAIECYRAVRARRPLLGIALGKALLAAGRATKAERVFRDLVRQQPNHPEMYFFLGYAQHNQNKYAEAEASYRKAIEINPAYHIAYYNLALTLGRQRKLVQEEQAYRKAIEINPDYAAQYFGLGNVLGAQKKYGESVTAYRKALSLSPQVAEVYNNLGVVLQAQKKLAEAETAFRKAIECKADYLQSHHRLGAVMMQQARFKEAAAVFRKASDLRQISDLERSQMRGWVRHAERQVELDGRLPGILKGTNRPAHTGEQIEYAHLCLVKRLPVAAERLYREAFAADPQRGEKVPAHIRCDAACAAALAGCGEGKDADRLDDRERSRLRRQALDWLRRDLDFWNKTLDKNDAKTRAAILVQLAQWQNADDLAGVRESEGLARLPEEERKQWQQIWAEVAVLIEKVEGKK
jgi:tetratricopeptide (TPR) repeat protein